MIAKIKRLATQVQENNMTKRDLRELETLLITALACLNRAKVISDNTPVECFDLRKEIERSNNHCYNALDEVNRLIS